VVVPYSNVTVVEKLFALTVALSVTVVEVRLVGVFVVAEGAVQRVVNVRSVHTMFPRYLQL
jgi:hypothetical protein